MGYPNHSPYTISLTSLYAYLHSSVPPLQKQLLPSLSPQRKESQKGSLCVFAESNAGRSRGGHLVGACASGERIAPRARSGADRAFASQGGAVKRHGPPLHTGVVPTTTATGQATLPFPSVTTTTPAPVTAPDATSEQTSESAPATTENSSSGSPSVPPSLITATTTKSASVTTTAFASATSEYAFVTTAQ